MLVQDPNVLQLFYYESVAIGEPSELSPTIFPCLASWGEEEISERQKQERELRGYGSGEVVYKERGLGMEMLGHIAQTNGFFYGSILPLEVDNYSLYEHVGFQGLEEHVNGDGVITVEENMPNSGNQGNAVCIDIEISGPVRATCRNTNYGCIEIVDYMPRERSMTRSALLHLALAASGSAISLARLHNYLNQAFV